jgi:hypothetical protein
VGLGGLARLPAWSADGRTLAFLGTDVAGAPDHAEIELFVWDGREARSLTGALDLPVTLAWGSDLHDWLGSPGMPAPIWDGEALIVPINRRGRDELWRVPLDGEPAPITAGETTLSAVSAAGGRLVATLTDDAYPPEVCAVEPGRIRRLTRHGGAWLRRHPAPAVREVDADGVPAFLFEPPGRTGAPRSSSPRTAAPTARTRRPPSWTRGRSSHAATESSRRTSAARAGTAATGWRPSRAGGAAPTPTTW